MNYVSFATKKFNINFTIEAETFFSGEMVEGQMVHVTESLSVKGSPQQAGPLALILREGPTHNSSVTEINWPVPS